MAKTVIIGASDKPERYSYKALNMLQAYGHDVALVHPHLKLIEGLPVADRLSAVAGPVDTITMYVNASLSDPMEAEILSARPRRVIFNPGTENPRLEKNLSASGIHVEIACTLVLLQTGQY